MNVIWNIGQISGLGPDAVFCATIPHTISQRVFINELKSLHGGNKQLLRWNESRSDGAAMANSIMQWAVDGQ